MTIKKFPIPMNTAVFTTTFVMRDKKDITTVYHYEEDGTWQFSSIDKHETFEDVAQVVSLEEIIKVDPSILDLAELQKGYFAQRNSRIHKWIIKKMQ